MRDRLILMKRPKFFASVMVLIISASAYARSGGVIDCTLKRNQVRHKFICGAVVDPLRAKRGECLVFNCADEFEDGYAIGVCKKVRKAEQKNLSRKCPTKKST